MAGERFHRVRIRKVTAAPHRISEMLRRRVSLTHRVECAVDAAFRKNRLRTFGRLQ